MKSLLTKLMGISMIVLLLGLTVGNLAIADKKELTPLEFNALSLDEKVKYKTVTIKVNGFLKTEDEVFKDYNKHIAGADVWWAQWLFSRTLFHFVHPKVRVVDVPWVPDDQLPAAIAGGTAPSFYIISGGMGLDANIEAGLAADITDIVNNDPRTEMWRDKYWWPQWAVLWKNGRCYGVPHQSNRGISLLTQYRRDWFKEAGIFNSFGEPGPEDDWTWEDLRVIAKKITNVKEKRWGFCMGPTEREYFRPIIDYGGLSIEDLRVPDKTGKYTWRVEATPQVREGLKFLKDFIWKDKSVLTGIEVDSQKEFNAGRAGMYTIMVTHAAADILQHPHIFDPQKSNWEFVGWVATPKGPYDRYMPLSSAGTGHFVWGFNPTLNKEELKAAYDYWHWTVGGGTGRYLELLQELVFGGREFALHSGFANHVLLFKDQAKKWPVGAPEPEDILPPDVLRIYNKQLYPNHYPVPLEPTYFGLSGPAEETTQVIKSMLMEAVLTDPNVDIEATLNKVSETLNSYYNYKTKGDKEKLKEYYTYLADFLKENCPIFYESEAFKEQFENYYKVW